MIFSKTNNETENLDIQLANMLVGYVNILYKSILP